MGSELLRHPRALLGLTALHGLHLLTGAALLLAVPFGSPAWLAGAVAVGAATYPPALAAVLPGITHETGKRVQQRIERDHQHLKGRLRPMRGFKTLAGARVLCRAHAFLRNLRGGFYDLGRVIGVATSPVLPAMVLAWEALTADLLAG